MIGQIISHYKILEKLGEGGMGVIYKAEDIKLKRTVALKFLPPDLTRDPEAKERFIQEAQAASALEHPNICNIHEIDETEDGQMFICMACYQGQTVKEKIEQGPLGFKEALDVAAQVAQGLAKAHGQGIVHRDIKPGNIFVTEDGRVKILDFGLAKLAGQMRITKTSSTLGTVAYMSPEQTQGEEVDGRTDIWSLGVVLYEMLTGLLPFKGDYEQAVVYSILNEEPKPMVELKEGIPEALQDLVNRALEKEPVRRYRNIEEMRADLQAIGGALAAGKEPHLARRGKRRTVPAIVIFTAAALATILAVLLTSQKQEQIPTEAPVVKIPIGVMFFDNQTSDGKYDYLRKVLADMLITDLSQSRYLQVLTFPRMFELLRSLGYEDVEIIDAPVGFELCKLAGAHVMVLGSLMKSGETFVINAQVLDVDTKKQIDAYRVTGNSENSILGHLVDDLTEKIKNGLEISVREIQQDEKHITALTTTSLEAYKYYFKGREAAFQMYNQEAIDNLENAVTLDPAFTEAYDALARQYYFIGESTKALKIIEKVKSFSSELAEEKLVEILALEALLMEDWDLAIKYLKRLITINPENIKAHIDLGMVYYQRRMMYDEGISEFKKALRLDPQGVTHRTGFAYNVLGYAYFRKCEYEKALEAFQKYVDLLPNQAYPLICLGEFYRWVGDYDKAMANLQLALAAKSDLPLVHVNLGHTYLAEGLYREALRSYETSLALSISTAQQAEAHFHLGNLYYRKGEHDQAIQECRQALALSPEMIEAHWIQGLAFARRGMVGEAENEARVIHELIEKAKVEELYKFYYHLLGEIFLNEGLYWQALENFNQAADIKSLERTFFVNALGEAYYKAEEWNKAEEQCRVALETNPNHASTHYLLGLVCEETGRKEEAKAHFQKFVDIWKDADADLPQLMEARKRL